MLTKTKNTEENNFGLEKEKFIYDKIEEIKSEIDRKWFYSYDILDNVINKKEVLKKFTYDKKTEFYIKVIKFIFFLLIIFSGTLVIFSTITFIWELYKWEINYGIIFIPIIIIEFVLCSAIFLYISIKLSITTTEKQFLRNLFWFENSKVLILQNMAIIWRKYIKIQNWDISWNELILKTLFINIDRKTIWELAENDYKKIPVDKNTKKLFQFKELFFELESLSKDIKNIKKELEKNIENIHSWKWEFQIMSENLEKLKNTNEKIISKKEKVQELLPQVNFKKYNLWLNESFILPLKWIKSFLIKNLEQIKNLILENENNQSEQIKLLQKRLEINKNLLEEKISDLDWEIKKLER